MSLTVMVKLASGATADTSVHNVLLDWTVEQLKRRIALVHPLKPVSLDIHIDLSFSVNVLCSVITHSRHSYDFFFIINCHY